ncbi:SDR family NAD(P)-dependent oxidoreductase [Oceanicoccus sagamiensis]|uniref:Short-chain dehydrogenase n=1 Tax=Oceanicoccus sagamiensis TaxID=716816 RepID=A0A1X9NP35_9GAMM|nr:SDR family NAD(P)-dependent oxidoreductase [Oceanicoccus sagamiensis]ARN75653.1 hypothetical protein BST96_16980 [Oceanicoccus sagamiensis]
MSFSFDSTCDDVVSGVDLSGKTAVVTGAYGGLGKETVRALASKGAKVIAVGRNQQRLDETVSELTALTANENISAVVMDLADLSSVKSASETIVGLCPQIDILINNAGIMACPLDRTAQGLEMQIGVNHVSHFLMTSLLLPALKAAASARVIALSSVAHKFSDVMYDDLNWDKTEYDRMKAYGSAKSANAVFAVEFNRLYGAEGITANAVHPGLILTELGRHFTAEDSAAMSSEGMQLKTIEQGAATSVWAATSPELEGKGGLYLEDCQIGEALGHTNPLVGYCDYIMDAEAGKNLWQQTEQLIDGLSF